MGSQMAVMLAGIRAGHVLQPQEKFLILISVEGSVNPRAIVRLEELDQLRTSIGVEAEF
jgi:hypothetical protein